MGRRRDMNTRNSIASILNTFFPDFCFFVEVGVCEGATSAHLLKNCPQMFIVLVDYWKEHWATRIHTKKTWIDKETVKGWMEKTIQRTDFAKNRRLILHTESTNAAKQFLPNTFDAVFIDATHEEEPLKRDLELWGATIKPGGFLFCHDIGGRIDKMYGMKLTECFVDYTKKNGFSEPKKLVHLLWYARKGQDND